ncbi:hypothetical protein PR048_028938 [Dryococelus australis]|uniref:Uncharacterized protein n=1 Tax=Dryococelus australis TaxID=614101 RepID=A0ABQ9GCK6_9NEOP|nr:hypothetical protein PR048_028938 [Dryococelus australis]
MQRRGNWKSRENRPEASSGTIPTCENPPGIDPDSPRREASSLTTRPPVTLDLGPGFSDGVTLPKCVKHGWANSEGQVAEEDGGASKVLTLPGNRRYLTIPQVAQEMCRRIRMATVTSVYRFQETIPQLKEMESIHIPLLSSQSQYRRLRKQQLKGPLIHHQPLDNLNTARVGRGVEWLDYSATTKANRAQVPAGLLPDSRMWELWWAKPLVGGLSRGSPVSPALPIRRCCILTSLQFHRLTRSRY